MRKPRFNAASLARDIFIELIEVHNSVPKDVEFKCFEGDWLRSRIDYEYLYTAIIPTKNKSSIDGVLELNTSIDFSNPGLEEEWFSEFQKYPVLSEFLLQHGNSIYEIEKQLEVFLLARNILQSIAEANWLQKYDQPHYSSVSLPGGELIITKNGVEFHEPPNILNIFRSCAKTGYLQRIKSCGECEKLFFAKRIDAIYCSRKCVNIYHQRKYIEDDKNRDRVNEQRRANYQRKRHVELIRGGANGTL